MGKKSKSTHRHIHSAFSSDSTHSLLFISFIIFVFLALFTFWRWYSNTYDTSPIKVGLVAELTGDMAQVGTSSKNAAEMAVRQVNRQGGVTIKGKKRLINLVVKDNKGSVQVTRDVVKDLINKEKVIAIIGPNASRFAIPASTIAETSQTVLISPWSTDPKTTLNEHTRKPKKYVFRAAYLDSFQGHVLAKFVLDTLKQKTAAVLFDENSDILKGQAEFFKKTFEANGGEVVSYIAKATEDFSSEFTEIIEKNPDIIFLPAYYDKTVEYIKQAHGLGIYKPFIGSDAWKNEELLVQCGYECNGFYLTAHYAPDAYNPQTKTFVSEYKKMHGATPDDVAALTYDSFGLLFKAISLSKELNREDVRNSLARISEYVGATGTMTFYEGSGDPTRSAAILLIRNGKFQWFTTINP